MQDVLSVRGASGGVLERGQDAAPSPPRKRCLGVLRLPDHGALRARRRPGGGLARPDVHRDAPDQSSGLLGTRGPRESAKANGTAFSSLDCRSARPGATTPRAGRVGSRRSAARPSLPFLLARVRSGAGDDKRPALPSPSGLAPPAPMPRVARTARTMEYVRFPCHHRA
jgi:hypothetical protein